jgi:hypothetical protein
MASWLVTVVTVVTGITSKTWMIPVGTMFLTATASLRPAIHLRGRSCFPISHLEVWTHQNELARLHLESVGTPQLAAIRMNPLDSQQPHGHGLLLRSMGGMRPAMLG